MWCFSHCRADGVWQFACMDYRFRYSVLKALFWFFGNFVYGLIPLAVIFINSLNTFIRFLDDGYLVFLSSALIGSIGIDVFMLGNKISGFISAFVNLCGYIVIIYTTIVYISQIEKNKALMTCQYSRYL